MSEARALPAGRAEPRRRQWPRLRLCRRPGSPLRSGRQRPHLPPRRLPALAPLARRLRRQFAQRRQLALAAAPRAGWADPGQPRSAAPAARSRPPGRWLASCPLRRHSQVRPAGASPGWPGSRRALARLQAPALARLQAGLASSRSRLPGRHPRPARSGWKSRRPQGRSRRAPSSRDRAGTQLVALGAVALHGAAVWLMHRRRADSSAGPAGGSTPRTGQAGTSAAADRGPADTRGPGPCLRPRLPPSRTRRIRRLACRRALAACPAADVLPLS